MNRNVATRLGVVLFAVLGIGACTCSFQLERDEPSVAPSPFLPIARSDSLESELSRCGQLGEPAAFDSACLKTWAANRRRFPGLREKESSASGGPEAEPSGAN